MAAGRHRVFDVLNPDATAPLLIVCDHGDKAIPRHYADLGVDAADLERHIGWDIGAAKVTESLAARLTATAVIARFSRLLVDPNRAPDDPTLMPTISDGTVVPGNRMLDAEERANRMAQFYQPYHMAVASEVTRLRASAAGPVVFSVHSFTPVMRGRPRPWHIGVLWDHDARVARPLLDALAAEGDLTVGDNEPYSGRGSFGYTIARHAEANDLPHALIEIRQDLIDTPAGVDRWADRLARVLRPILDAPSTFAAPAPRSAP